MTNNQHAESLALLRENIIYYFNDDELRTLCFDLGISYDDLAGDSKPGKARELVNHLKRRGRIFELIHSLGKLRPQVEWGFYQGDKDVLSEGTLSKQKRDDLVNPLRSPVLNNIPQPDYEVLVGRVSEMEQLHRLLSPVHRSWVITIDGIGGIGKTALALELAAYYRDKYEALPMEERFDAIIWTTAKQNVLTGTGIRPQLLSHRTLDDVFRAIAITMDRKDILRSSLSEQADLILHLLSQKRVLLIIDNLETIDDERIMNFIRDVPVPTKVLVTTRHRLDVAYPTRLNRLNESEALSLIYGEALKKLVQLNDIEAGELLQHTYGVPLAIVWSLAQLSFGYDLATILDRLQEPNDDIARFCFEQIFTSLQGSPAHRLLVGLALFSPSASREALGSVAEVDGHERDEGLASLEKLSLITRRGGRFEMSPLVQSYIQAQLIRDHETELEYRKRWLNFLLTFLESQAAFKYQSVDAVALEIESVIATIDWTWRTDQLRVLIRLFQLVDFYLWTLGRWNDWIRSVDMAIKAAVILEDELTEAHLSRRLSTTHYHLGNLETAKELIGRVIRVYEVFEDWNSLTIAVWRLAAILLKEGKLNDSRSSLQRALVLTDKTGDERQRIRIERKLAAIDIEEGNYAQAEETLKRARRAREKQFQGQEDPPSTSGLAHTYRLLGILEFRREDYAAARGYLLYSLSMAERINVSHDIAETKTCLARLELKLGNYTEAYRFASDALTLFISQGMKLEIREVRDLLAEVESNRQNK